MNLPGDQILADRGFTLQEDFATVCSAELIIPAFTRGKSVISARGGNLPSNELCTHTYRTCHWINEKPISDSTRYHASYCVEKMKDESEEAQLACVDKIVHVCAALTNNISDVNQHARCLHHFLL